MKSFFKHLYTIILIFITTLATIAGVYFFKLGRDVESIEIKLENISSNPKILDINGNEIKNDLPRYYEYASYSEISENLINALVAIEDKTFFSHNGLNYKRILKAFIENITNGHIVSGASTITQQYIKNAYLSQDQTLDRKIKEMILAIRMERELTKEQILEGYLNTILFGGNVYGIKMASKYYFSKDPIDLTVSEAALLAGLIQLPNYYNPIKNPDIAIKRRNIVLYEMYKENYISLDEYNSLVNLTIEEIINPSPSISRETYTSSYLDYLCYELNYYDYNIFSDNLVINTYMNPEIQRELFYIVSNYYHTFDSNTNIKCAIVAIDNQTLGIVGLCGNEKSDALVTNRVLINVQPGSTIKPILDYAPALEYLGYNASSIIVDEPYTFSNGSLVKNWDNSYMGAITFRKALATSRNIPALKLFKELNGMNIPFAKSLGLNIGDSLYEAEALGGATNGYSLLSITNAYTSFANLGVYEKCHALKSINNEEIYYEKKRVMKESTAFIINSILHDVFKDSIFDNTNTYMMAKTGQTTFDKDSIIKYNIPANATKDSLIICYTKDLTFGIWVGFDNISSTNYLDRFQTQIPRTIMKSLSEAFFKKAYYTMPKSVVAVKVKQYGNETYLDNDGYIEYYKKGSEPINYYKDYGDPV